MCSNQREKIKGLSWTECFLQIFYSIQGQIFFVLPGGFKNVGYIPGIIVFLSTGLLNLYFIHLYLWCEKEVRKRDKLIKIINLSSLVEHVFSEFAGMPRLALYLRTYLKYEIIISWLIGLAYFMLIVCQNLAITLNYYGYFLSNKVIFLYMCIPTSIISLIPNLKAVAWSAHLSSIIIIIFILETLFYIFTDETPLPKVSSFGDISFLPTYFSIITSAVGFTPLIFPFKNEMKNPEIFGSSFGSLNIATMFLLILNSAFSLLCYLRFGVSTQENIVDNLPRNQLVALTSAAMTVTMICGGALAFYAVFQMLWCDTLDVYFQNSKNIRLYKYTAKIVVFAFIISVALFVPSLDILINFSSCFSWPYDIIFIPVAMETVIELKFNPLKWRKVFIIIKNVILTAFCIIFCIISFVISVCEYLDFMDSER